MIASALTRVFPSPYLLTQFVISDPDVAQVLDVFTDNNGMYVLLYASATVPTGGGIAGSQAFAGHTTRTVTLPSPIAGAAYKITLSPSPDTGDSSIPIMGWANKLAAGFDIVTPVAYTGTVDWVVIPT